MRTRFAGQLMPILSFSFQGDTTERTTAWEREIATLERDSNMILDDEIKVGAVLLMRVDKRKKWTDFRDEVAAISRAIAVAQSQLTPMDIGAVGKVKSGTGGKGSRGAGKRNSSTQQACSRCGNTGVNSDSVEIGRCECQDGRECTVRFAKQRTGHANDAVRTNLACLVRRFGEEFPGGHPVLTWLVKYSVAMVNR